MSDSSRDATDDAANESESATAEGPASAEASDYPRESDTSEPDESISGHAATDGPAPEQSATEGSGTARFAPGWNREEDPSHLYDAAPQPGSANSADQGASYPAQGSHSVGYGPPTGQQSPGYGPNGSYRQANGQPGHPGRQPRPPGNQPGHAGNQPSGHLGAHPQGSAYPQSPQHPQSQAPLSASKYLSAFGKSVTWRSALIPAGLALLAGVIVSIIISVLLTSIGDFSSLIEDTGFNTGSIGYALPFVLLALSLFGSAVFRFDVQAGDMGQASGSFFASGAPLLITVIVVGVLWWFTKRSELKSPSPNRGTTWIRIGITTLSMALVLLILELIFAARFSSTESGTLVDLEFSAVTVRSFFLPLLAILITSVCARAAGHFKGTEAIGAPFLRWLVPPVLVTVTHLVVTTLVMSVVAIFVIPISLDMPWQTVPALLINVSLILTLLVHLGGVSASTQGDVMGYGSDRLAESLTIFSRDVPGMLWIGLIVVVAAVLAATLVATVTRRPYWTVAGEDKQQWTSAWRIPLAFCVVWGLLSILAVPLRAHLEGSAAAASMFDEMGTARAGVGPLSWSFLVFMLWGVVIEVLSRTFGPRLALTVPAITRFLAGRAVHPHWGQALGMSEPRFPLIHPDAITAHATRPVTDPGMTGPGGAPGAMGPGGHPPAAGPTMPGGVPASGAAPAAGPAATSGSAPTYGSVSPSDSEPGAYSASANNFDASNPGPMTGAPHGAYTNAGPPPPPGAVPIKPFDKKKATLVGVISGSAVLVIVAALIVVTQLNGHVFGPEATVEKYFSALSDGDAKDALKMADVDVPSEQRQLLTNDILGASKSLPKDITVEDAQVEGNSATVSATYDVGGSKSTTSFSLYKSGKKALFFDQWKLEAPELFSLSVETPGLSTVKVNGIDIDTDGSKLSLPAFPGMYSVDLTEETDLVSADAVETRAFFAGDSDMEGAEPALLAAQPTDAFRTEVNNQVKTLIDSCAKKTVAQPDGCPFGSYSAKGYDATNIKWSISSYPTVSVASDSSDGGYFGPKETTGSNGGPAWPITTETTGEALVTGKYDSFFKDSDTFDDTLTFSVNGTAEIVDGKVVINIEDDPYGF